MANKRKLLIVVGSGGILTPGWADGDGSKGFVATVRPNVKARLRFPAMIQDRMEKLPPALRKEALDYIEFLLKKHHSRLSRKPMRFDWAGRLSHLRDRYSSVELQHKASEWR